MSTKGDKATFSAFLSYAHADERWARWLHGKLESYRIPADLAGNDTPLGTVPTTLRPVFRDRHDFAGGETLNEATTRALDRSRSLIVICSTASAGRPIVNEEIRLFRWRHPDRPVVPVIVDGRFPANFPAALRYAVDAAGRITDQPETRLGADLRSDHDGRELGLAKIVAGLTGLETDVVFARAERSRRRRLQLIAASTAIVLVIVSALSLWAEYQRGRFANFLTLAKSFNAFQVDDDTMGWYGTKQLAKETLDALQRIASRPPWSGAIRILWFDTNPDYSKDDKKRFREGMRKIGVEIFETDDIEIAKQKMREDFDVIIANMGSAEDKFAYQLIDERPNTGRSTPLVIYGGEPNSAYAREAICYGAVARATTVGPLFAAVARALSPERAGHNAARLRCNKTESRIAR